MNKWFWALFTCTITGFVYNLLQNWLQLNFTLNLYIPLQRQLVQHDSTQCICVIGNKRLDLKQKRYYSVLSDYPNKTFATRNKSNRSRTFFLHILIKNTDRDHSFKHSVRPHNGNPFFKYGWHIMTRSFH